MWHQVREILDREQVNIKMGHTVCARAEFHFTLGELQIQWRDAIF
jgi:hypothetical protein